MGATNGIVTRWLPTLASASLIALILLCVAWELVLAPLRPGGSWLVLKAVPLLFALRGVLHGRRYTFQWACLLACGYLCEGLTRAWTDAPPGRGLAILEVVLALAFLLSAMFHVRLTRTSPA